MAAALDGAEGEWRGRLEGQIAGRRLEGGGDGADFQEGMEGARSGRYRWCRSRCPLWSPGIGRWVGGITVRHVV